MDVCWLDCTESGNGGGVIVDSSSNPPHLYIADTYNNRILGYRDARRVRPNDPADIVIGQNDLSHTLANAPFNNIENGPIRACFGRPA